jgi:hypothetical protein
MIPALEQAFPGVTLVLRPHPSEDHGVYHQLAARCSRVRVTHRGNVVPWLLACKALVHNGCTTAVESYAMGVPSVAYLKTFDPTYDRDFQGLPNRLSEQCFSLDELIGTVQAIIAGTGPAAATTERDALLNHYIAARTGPLASERILDLLDVHYRQQPLPDPGPAYRRLKASVMARLKGGLTRLNMHRPGPNRRAYHDHRFPRLSAADVARRIERLSEALGRFRTVRVRQRAEHLFDVFAAGS